MPWNHPFIKLSAHMMGMLVMTPGTTPNARVTRALRRSPTVAKYFGFDRSEIFPMTNLLTPYATESMVRTMPRSAFE